MKNIETGSSSEKVFLVSIETEIPAGPSTYHLHRQSLCYLSLYTRNSLPQTLLVFDILSNSDGISTFCPVMIVQPQPHIISSFDICQLPVPGLDKLLVNRPPPPFTSSVIIYRGVTLVIHSKTLSKCKSGHKLSYRIYTEAPSIQKINEM